MRILIVNLNWIGDVIFSTPAVRLIKEFYPSAYLACMAAPRCKEVLEKNPYIDELIFFDEKGLHRSFLSRLKFIFYLRRKHFEIVFIFHRSFTRALICRLAGIAHRIGYARGKSGFLLTKRVKPVNNIHRVDYFLNLLKAQGMETADRNYQFFIDEKDKSFADKFLEEKGILKTDILVSLNPGGNWRLKRWPADCFAELADLISGRYNAKILLTGAGKDRELVMEIAEKMKSSPVICAGETSLRQTAALFKRSSLVVSADSGPMHIAVSVGAPTIALFGPTSLKITGPVGKGRFRVIQKDTGCQIPCYQLNCRINKCMSAIRPGDVIKVIDEEKFI